MVTGGVFKKSAVGLLFSGRPYIMARSVPLGHIVLFKNNKKHAPLSLSLYRETAVCTLWIIDIAHGCYVILRERERERERERDREREMDVEHGLNQFHMQTLQVWSSVSWLFYRI